MNGRPWTEADTETLKRMHQLPNRDIARITGHAEITIRKRRSALGLPTFRGRETWSRRDWLLADAAGLDFQIFI